MTPGCGGRSSPLSPSQVLQKLGKTVETKDEQFEQSAYNFHLQQVMGDSGDTGDTPTLPRGSLSPPPAPGAALTPSHRRVLQNEGHKLYKDLKGFVAAVRGAGPTPNVPGKPREQGGARGEPRWVCEPG